MVNDSLHTHEQTNHYCKLLALNLSTTIHQSSSHPCTHTHTFFSTCLLHDHGDAASPAGATLISGDSRTGRRTRSGALLLLLRFLLDQQRVATIGARRMRREPRVNAPHMKPVIALWQHPKLIPFLELPEAYGALRRRNLLAGTVHRHRNLAQVALLQPRRGEPRRGLFRRLVGESPATAKSTTRYGVQPQGANQCAQQRRQNYHHVGVEVRFAYQRVVRVVVVVVVPIRRWHAQLRVKQTAMHVSV